MAKKQDAPKITNKVLKEAVALAKTIQQQAVMNAKDYLVEDFTPRVKNMLKTKLREEDEELEDEILDDEDEELEIEEDELEDEIEDEEEIEDDEELEEEDELEMDDEDEEDEEFDEEEDDLDLEIKNAIKEIEDEDEDEEEEELEEEFELDDEEEIEDEDEDEIDEDDELEIDLVEDDELETENARLNNEVKKLTKTLNFTIGKLQETNLLNSKLHYMQLLNKRGNLTTGQKNKVLEHIDRATTPREVKYAFTILAESFKTAKTKKLSSASTHVRKTKKDKKILSESTVFSKERLQKLSGITK